MRIYCLKVKSALYNRPHRVIENIRELNEDIVRISEIGTLNFEFTFRSKLFPSWILNSNCIYQGQEISVSSYLRQYFQFMFIHDTDLSCFKIMSMEVYKKRCIKDLLRDDDISACEMLGFCMICPIYVPFCWLPNSIADLIMGRELTFHLIVEREDTPNTTIGLPISTL